MLQHNKNLQKGYMTSNLSITVLWAVSLIISFVLIILFTVTLYNSFKEHRLKVNLEKQTNIIRDQVSKNFSDLNKNIEETINSSLIEYQPEDSDQLIDVIKQKLPSAIRVLVSQAPLDEIKPTEFPGINFATLFMLKSAKNLNTNPVPEIHLFGQKDQYINYTHILNNENNRFLIISLPTNEVLKNLNVSKIRDGGIILTQNAGKFSLVRLKTWGNYVTKNNAVQYKTDIPDSYFSVEYAYQPPFYFLRGMTTLSALVGMFSSILLFVAVMLSVLKKLKGIKLQKEEDSKNAYVHVEAGSKAQPNNLAIGHQQDSDDKKPPENSLDESIFRAYDIRGIVDESLTVDAVRLIGQAIGTENIKRGKNEIIVARDGRLSGEKLLKALVEGLNNSGCNVINIGAVPTGVLYFATHHLGTGSGVMLTGSHNPPNYNGLKIMLNGETLAGKLIKDLYKSIINQELDSGSGTEQSMDIVDDYVDYISSDIQLEDELKVVVDCGNGIGGDVGPMVLEEIGCEVIRLHCEIDGNFPNHHPDPSVPENLQDLIAAVKETDADIGIAFDGDADRLGVVTKDGQIIYPDRLLMLFAQDVLTRQPGASIIFDVKCTGHLPKEIVKYGGLPIIWKTGHSFMKAKIKETKAALAGEMSGHFFFNERWFGFDDGIYAAARLLEILDTENRPAIEVFDELPNSISTPELKCHTEEGENYAF
ncbi:MAG: phosphomannomutase/phosphoglucomutase, partial [Proteobacteria bacterium]|nr:phosphomannomutase/phosphoglucomutase [Pseudomonadota bacterium]